MSTLDFLFSSALWALPLAALPIILHLLFRRKSPVVQFSTIRFLKLSVQQTAARKKVQRWLLLACRALLLALLIAAVAQPRTRPASQWAASPQSLAAAIVVDTSYSMRLQSGGMPLLNKANSIVEGLLAGELHDANVAVFRSSPPDPADAEQNVLRDQEAGSRGSRITWTPLVPQPAAQPLVDRVPVALDFLRRSAAADQRLIVISDFQNREFPHTLPDMGKVRPILLDLHPTDARSDGITQISLDPARPTPGIGSEVIVEVAGRPGSDSLVGLSLQTLEGRNLQQAAPRPVSIDSSGFGRVRFAVRLPAERWMVAMATLQNEDDMPWDNTRSRLIEVPSKQIVTLLPSVDFPEAVRFLKLALDPSEGTSTSWPVNVKASETLAPDASAAVAILNDWPDAKTTSQWNSFVRGGGTLVCFVRPGLQATWGKLPDSQKKSLLELLPAEPLGDANEVASSAGVAATNDALLAGLTDQRYQIGSIVAQRFVPFANAQQTGTPLLNLFPLTPTRGTGPYGLLFRKTIGSGTVFTFSTIPDPQYTNLATHPIFLPLLVRMALPATDARHLQNVELGQPISASGHDLANVKELWVHGPQKAIYPGKLISDANGRHFVFANTTEPGLYTWSKPNDEQVLAVSNVQPPSAESPLVYRAPESIPAPGQSVVVAHSLDELHGKIATMSEPNPRWPIPIAAVMVLLCFEALMGASTGPWRVSLRAIA